jgi:hypothetical protein
MNLRRQQVSARRTLQAALEKRASHSAFSVAALNAAMPRRTPAPKRGSRRVWRRSDTNARDRGGGVLSLQRCASSQLGQCTAQGGACESESCMFVRRSYVPGDQTLAEAACGLCSRFVAITRGPP